MCKDIKDINNTVNQLDPTDIHRIRYPTTSGYTFSLSIHKTLTKMDHILG